MKTNIKTIVTANPQTGKIFTQALDKDGQPKLDKNGQQYGYIRVESRERSLGYAYSRGGIKLRSALVSMTMEAWNKSKEDYTHGVEVPGKIVRQDALTAFYEGQKPLQAPKKDANGKVIEGEFVTITSGGAPVYRNEFYTEIEEIEDIKLEMYDKLEGSPATATKKEPVLVSE